MEFARDSRAIENNALQILSGGLTYPDYKFIDRFFWNHNTSSYCALPTPTGAATARTAAAETAESSTTSTSAAPVATAKATTETPATPPAAPASSTQKKAQQQTSPERRSNEDNEDYDEDRNPASRETLIVLLWSYRRRRMYAGELNTCIPRNHVGNPRDHERHRTAIVALSQEWNGLTADAAGLAVRQNRLQPVANLDSVPVVLSRDQNQHTAIGGFAADPPFLIQIDGIALDIGAIQGLNCNYGNLCVCLLIDLTTDVIDLSNGGLVENMREIVDVARRL